MEITINISSPNDRIVPITRDAKIDVSITGMTSGDAHRYCDTRPLIEAVLNAYVEMSRLPQNATQELKEDVKRVIYGEDAQ